MAGGVVTANAVVGDAVAVGAVAGSALAGVRWRVMRSRDRWCVGGWSRDRCSELFRWLKKRCRFDIFVNFGGFCSFSIAFVAASLCLFAADSFIEFTTKFISNRKWSNFISRRRSGFG